MPEVGTAFVTIVPSARGFASKLNGQVGTAAAGAGTSGGKRFGGAFSGAAGAALKGFGGVLAGIGIAKFFTGAVREASDLSESINAVRVSYGKAGDDILRIGQNSAKAFGLSKSQFNGFAVQFQSFSKTIAGTDGNVSKTFKNIIGRATDFASVMNLDVNEAATLFQSGLAGETEPLRRYGIDLSAAAVEAFALKKGIGSANGELTEAQKVQARYGLLMEKTSKTQGDFQNTSKGVANQQRILSANWKDLQAKVGTAFLPVLAKLALFLNTKVGPALAKLAPIFRKVGAFIQGLFQGGDGGSQLAKTFAALVAFAKPLLAILLDLGKKALAIIGPALSEIGTLITTQLLPAFRTLLPILAPVAAFLLRMFGGAVLGLINGFVNVVKGAFQIITGVFQVFAALFTGDWDLLWKGLGNILRGAWNVIKGIFQIAINVGILGVLRKLPAIVGAIFKGLFRLMGSLAKAGWGLIKGVFRTAMNSVKSNVSSGVKSIVQFFKDLPGKIKSGIGNLGKLLLQKGKDLVHGFVSGIKSLPGAIKDALLSLIPGPLKKFAAKLGLKSPSTVFRHFGEMTVAGFVQGIERGSGSVTQATLSMANAALVGGRGLVPAVSSASLVGAGGQALPDMPIVDGTQVIGFLRDLATERARIELAKNTRNETLAARFIT